MAGSEILMEGTLKAASRRTTGCNLIIGVGAVRGVTGLVLLQNNSDGPAETNHGRLYSHKNISDGMTETQMMREACILTNIFKMEEQRLTRKGGLECSQILYM